MQPCSFTLRQNILYLILAYLHVSLTVVQLCLALTLNLELDMAGIKPVLLFIHCGGVVAVVYVEK